MMRAVAGQDGENRLADRIASTWVNEMNGRMSNVKSMLNLPSRNLSGCCWQCAQAFTKR